MRDSTDSLMGLLAFAEKANSALRLALLIAVFWPFSVIGTAMVLTPATAQTVVPIVDMVPLAAIFLLILGAPFGLLALLSDPSARKGFTWLAGLIGVELTIGVYFSTIPVSRDIGLIPLLVLTAFAILFLRMGGFTGFATKALAFVIVGITIVFLLGGRKPFESRVENALPPPALPSTQQPSPTPPAVSLSAPTIMPTTPSTPTPPQTSEAGTINISSYSSDGWYSVTLPDSWPGWCAEPFRADDPAHSLGLDPDPNHTWTIAFRFPGGEVLGPVHWSNRREDSLPMRNPPHAFQIQGYHSPGGGITFYPYPADGSGCAKATWPYPRAAEGNRSVGGTTGAAPAVAPAPAAAAPPPAAPQTPPPIDSGPLVVTQTFGQYEFGFWPCRWEGESVVCEGYMKSQYGGWSAQPLNLTGLADNLANIYAASTFTEDGQDCRNGCDRYLPPYTSVRFRLIVDGVVDNAASLALTFKLSEEGSGTGGWYSTDGQITLTVPITQPSQ